MPKVSVIVPVYNAESTVEKCVASITAQDLRDIEIILVDDGSADNSFKICSRLAEQDNRIKVIRIENSGPATARNIGIDTAAGEFVTFCDSDDYISNGTLSYMYTKISMYDVLCCGLLFDFEGQSLRKVYPRCTALNPAALRELKDNNLLDTMCNKLYRTSFIKAHGLRLPDGELYEDTAFNQALLMLKPKVLFSKRCFYHYVQRQKESITRRFNPSKFELMHKRNDQLLKLEQVLGGNGSTWGMFYLRTLLSSFTDCFVPGCPLSKKELKGLIKKEKADPKWKRAASTATAKSKSDRALLFAAKRSGLFIMNFCKLSYILKYKMRKLFLAMR